MLMRAIRSSQGNMLCCQGQDGRLSAKVWLALRGQGNVLVITRRCHADAAASQIGQQSQTCSTAMWGNEAAVASPGWAQWQGQT